MNQSPRLAPSAQHVRIDVEAIDSIRFNWRSLFSSDGYLRIVELILAILCIGFASPPELFVTIWFLVVAAVSIVSTLFWMCIYLFAIDEAVDEPTAIEFWHIGLVAFANITAFVLQLAGWTSAMLRDSVGARNVAAGIFGLFNSVAYMASTALLYARSRSQAE